MIGAGGVNAVLVGDDFPELKLEMQNIHIHKIDVISSACVHHIYIQSNPVIPTLLHGQPAYRQRKSYQSA